MLQPLAIGYVPHSTPPRCTRFIVFLCIHALTDNFFIPFDLSVMFSHLLGYVDRFVFFPKKITLKCLLTNQSTNVAVILQNLFSAFLVHISIRDFSAYTEIFSSRNLRVQNDYNPFLGWSYRHTEFLSYSTRSKKADV